MSRDESRPDDAVDLRSLYADRSPPDTLEERVVRSLASQGLLRARAQGRRRLGAARAVLGVAAGVLLFAAGWGLGRGAAAPELDPTGPGFMLLLWEGPAYAPAQDGDAVAAAYAAWATSVAERGVPISGDELGGERTLLAPAGIEPDSPRELTLGGYFLVGGTAESVTSLARDHPHLANGGWVEVVPLAGR
jgi:hypothetical protein